MDKATVNMTNWELYVYEDHYSLSGTADDHPMLGKNTYVSRASSLFNLNFLMMCWCMKPKIQFTYAT